MDNLVILSFFAIQQLTTNISKWRRVIQLRHQHAFQLNFPHFLILKVVENQSAYIM